MQRPSDPDSDAAEEEILDAAGRPYFLWDLEMTLAEFRLRLRDPDPEVRAYLIGKLLRQARPADVARFVSEDEVRAIWPLAERYVGRARDLWRARLGLGGAPHA